MFKTNRGRCSKTASKKLQYLGQRRKSWERSVQRLGNLCGVIPGSVQKLGNLAEEVHGSVRKYPKSAESETEEVFFSKRGVQKSREKCSKQHLWIAAQRSVYFHVLFPVERMWKYP